MRFFFVGVVVLFISCSKELDQQERFSYLDYNLDELQYQFTNFPAHFGGKVAPSQLRSQRAASLGRLLFYDEKLSLNNSTSCATCHKQQNAFADNTKFSIGLHNETTDRNAMSLVNVGFDSRFFWDLQDGGLEANILKPVSNHLEMGIGNLDILEDKLNEINGYPELFERAFYGSEISEEAIARALSTFIASMNSYNSKFDQGVRNNFKNFTIEEEAGRLLFFGKAKCSKCHSEPLFNRNWAFNIGLDQVQSDEGFRNGAFKAATLRNIELTAPFMHDGRFKTLEEVVEHYNSGIKNNESLDWVLRDDFGNPQRLELSDIEKSDLVAFLRTLTDWDFVSDKRYSSPYNN